MGSIWQDAKFGARMLFRAPGFTAVAVLTLALGIGANTAIFTVTNALLLRPLPYRDPGKLALVYGERSDSPGQLLPFSYPRFTQMNSLNKSFDGIAAFASDTFTLTNGAEPEQISAGRVSWNFFDVLGVRPELGRTFVAAEDAAGSGHVAVLSYRTWMRRFAGDKSIVGNTIGLDSNAYTVIGVLPPNFTFPLMGADTEIWVPRVFELNLITPQQVAGGSGFLNAIARLRPGVTQEQARAEMNVLSNEYVKANPGRPDSDAKMSIAVGNVQDVAAQSYRPAVLILLGAVGVVLLIACANVASLLMSRALSRKKEIAVRTALGAPRAAVIRQLLTESMLLAVASGTAGILIGIIGIRVLLAVNQQTLTQLTDLPVDSRVLGFTAVVTLASGILFGLIPSLQTSKTDLNVTLRDEGRGSAGGRQRHSLGNLLIVSQVALSMILLVGSGLLVRSFVRLLTVSPGFQPKNVLTIRISLPPAKYTKPADIIAFYNALLANVANLPGVQSAAISSALPVNPTRQAPVLMEGQPRTSIGHWPILNLQMVSPGYAKTLGVRLLQGREFTDTDNAPRPQYTIVNQALVKRFWPNENPIGKRIWLGSLPDPLEVVGVFEDTKNMALTASATPELFIPFPELPWRLLNLDLRTSVEPHSITSAVRKAISQLDSNLPATNVQSMGELLAAARAQSQFVLVLFGVFAGLALILAIVGIYGVIAYSVAQRTREMGIRMALGAARGDILRLVVGQGLTLAGFGIGIGLAASLGLTRFLASELYGISALDPVTFVASAALFLAAAAVASYIPAQRATRVAPIEALRYE